MFEIANGSTIAAFLSAVAAIAAAIATWRGPIAAARMAEQLRQSSADAQERRRTKLNVFGAIMQDRAQIHTEDAVRALNLIDVAFNDSTLVREAWAELHQAFNMKPIPDHVLDERIRNLLKAMASDLGLSADLKQADFDRVYFPNVLAEESHWRRLERQAAIARLTGSDSPAANTIEGPSEEQKWPPKPE